MRGRGRSSVGLVAATVGTRSTTIMRIQHKGVLSALDFVCAPHNTFHPKNHHRNGILHSLTHLGATIFLQFVGKWASYFIFIVCIFFIQ